MYIRIMSNSTINAIEESQWETGLLIDLSFPIMGNDSFQMPQFRADPDETLVMFVWMLNNLIWLRAGEIMHAILM